MSNKGYDEISLSIPPRVGKNFPWNWYYEYEKIKRYCCTCDWYAEFEGVCTNGDSEFRADFRCLDDTCTEWMSREGKPCEEKF